MTAKYVKRDCPECDGRGEIELNDGDSDSNIGNSIVDYRDCDMCHGTGKIEVEYESEYNPEDE